MSEKKRRQRGSRSHGGGSSKNRRGAGHRGGRGRAGRDKHEMHNYPSREKHGFTRPPDTQPTVGEVDLQRLDEDAALLAAENLAEPEGDGYRIDARALVEGEPDTVKVLGSPDLHNELTVVADEFSAGAIEQLEAAGGAAVHGDDGAEEADSGPADGGDEAENDATEGSADTAEPTS